MSDEAARRLYLEHTGATEEQVDKAAELAAMTGESLGAVLELMGAISPRERMLCLATHMGVPFVDLAASPPPPEVAALVPFEVQRKHMAVPVSVKVTLAMCNPLATFYAEEIARETGLEVTVALAPEADVRAALKVAEDRLSAAPAGPDPAAASAVQGDPSEDLTPSAEDAAALPDDLPSEVRVYLAMVLEDTRADLGDVAEALARWQETGEHVGHALVSQGAITERERVRCLGKQWGIGYVDLTETEPDPAAVSLAPRYQLERGPAIPLRVDEHDRSLYLAMADPTDVILIDAIQVSTGYRVRPLIALAEDIRLHLGMLEPE